MDNSVSNETKKVMITIACLLRGGTEQQTLLLVKALIESDYNVEVCCYFEYDVQMVADFKAAGADVLLLKWPRDTGAIKFILSLAAVCRTKSPDMVHVQYIAPGLLPIIAAKLARVPVILATVHYPGTPHGFLAKAFLRFGAFLSDCFTCVSEASEKSWFGDSFLLNPSPSNNITARKHLTIPNAVDIASIDKALAERTPKILQIAGRLEGKTVIGTVARLSHEKGLDILLKAFAVAKEVNRNIHLLIIGDGVQKDYLKKLAVELGITDSCTWMGRLPWNEAISCLALMDIVVVPSRFEGFGLTAIEAMACGKPVIAGNVDGLAEIIQDGINGFLVQAEDIQSFTDCIVELVKEEAKRKSIGKAARKCVPEKYAYPIFRERIRVLYQAVGEQRSEVGERTGIR